MDTKKIWIQSEDRKRSGQHENTCPYLPGEKLVLNVFYDNSDYKYYYYFILFLLFFKVVTGNRGIYQSINVQKKSMTVKDYVDYVNKK